MKGRDRIAILRLSALGDVVLASAAIDALAPHATLCLVTGRHYTPLYERDSRLDRLVAFDRGNATAVRRALDAFQPTGLLDLQHTLKSRRLLRGVRAERCVRVQKDSWRRRITAWGILRLRPAAPVALRFVAAASEIAGVPLSARPRLEVPEPERGAETRVGLCPGSAWANKRWPLDRFLALGEALLRKRANVTLSAFVGPGETDIADAFAARFGGDTRVAVEAPTIGELPDRLARLAVLVTGDSGPLHVAEAVGTPVVALFGPTTEHFGFRPWRPESRVVERALPCRPCHVHGGNRCPLGHHACMRSIDVADVLDAVTTRR